MVETMVGPYRTPMSTPAAMPVRVRGSEFEDAPFILDSWLRSFRDAWPNKTTPPQVFFSYYRPITHQILQRPSVRALVACNPEHPGRFYGHAVVEAASSPVLHYLFVKRDFRGLGFARALCRAAGIDDEVIYTFRGPFVGAIARKVATAVYVPIEEFLQL